MPVWLVTLQLLQLAAGVLGELGSVLPVHAYGLRRIRAGVTFSEVSVLPVSRSAALANHTTPSGRAHVGPVRSKREADDAVVVASNATNWPVRPFDVASV